MSGRPQVKQALARDTPVDVSVMTAWWMKEAIPCTFGLVHILKRQCGWMVKFLFHMVPGTVLREVFLETFSSTENFLPHPPSMNGFPWACFISRFQSWFEFLPSVSRHLLWVTSWELVAVNSLAQVGDLFQLHALCFELE